jgi:hypothetical protein
MLDIMTTTIRSKMNLTLRLKTMEVMVRIKFLINMTMEITVNLMMITMDIIDRVQQDQTIIITMIHTKLQHNSRILNLQLQLLKILASVDVLTLTTLEMK